MRFLSLLLFALIINANEIEYLSKTKQQKLNLQNQINEYTSDIEEFSWINPVTAKYSYSKNENALIDRETNSISVSLNQPVFRSGGIYFAIKYANADRKYLKSTLISNKKSLLKQMYISLFNLKKLDLQIQKQKRLVRNAQIDVIKKQEQYEKGMLDSTFLNNAIITKNIVQNTLITLKSSRFEALKIFEALSDYDYKDIPLPNFKLISKDEFIKKHIDIKMLDFVSKKAKYAKKLTLSSYLPAIYVNGSYNNLDEEINKKSTKDEYFKYGLSASMPIFDVNVFRNIEKSKLSYLKSKLEVEDKKQEQQKAWEDIAFRIEMLNERKEIAKENFEFYKKLLKITEDDFKIGQKTSLDVELMRNSKLNALSDLKIYDISIQLELLNLYAKMSDEI